VLGLRSCDLSRRAKNVLLCQCHRPQVGDFGLSTILPRGEYDAGDKEAMKAYNKLSDRWGTPQYFAPEMLRKAYGPQVHRIVYISV